MIYLKNCYFCKLNLIKMRHLLFFGFLVFGMTFSAWAQEPQIEKEPEFIQESDTVPEFESEIADRLSWEYDWVSYQSKINLDFNDNSQTVNAFFVNRKDSIIYININKFGLELVRVVLTPEQVRYANSLKNEFYEGDYHFLSEKLGVPLSFEVAQSVLTGTEYPEFAGFPLSVEYIPEPSVAENRFFSLINVKLPFENMKFQVEVKNLKWNVPGPTALKIPDKYKSIE